MWARGVAGVGKASLNLIKITELSARAVRQEVLDGRSVWMRGVARGGKGLIESH